MHNWWIASLEHFGLITHEEAEHISREIRLSIHKDNYNEAKRELDAILDSGKFAVVSDFKQLRGQVESQAQQIATLTKALADNVVFQTGVDNKKQNVANTKKA